MSAVDPAVVALLRCPHCGAPLAHDGPALRCARGHAFDVARQGAVTLLGPGARPPAGDTAAMVAARAAFLARGHFDGITAAVVAACTEADPPPGAVVDLGAGTGHHLARVLDALPGRVGLALDAAKPAARRAARAHPRLGAVVCDVWGPLPVRDAVAALALSVFAPRNGPEIARVLVPGGSLVVAAPTPRHLGELVPALGLLRVDERKRERLAARLGPHLRPAGEREHEQRVALRHEDVARLVAMGPSAWHVDPAATAARIAALPDPFTMTVSVTVARFRRATEAADRRAPASPGGRAASAG